MLLRYQPISAGRRGWAIVLAVIVCTALGVVIERLAYKPLRMAPSLAVLITAIGVCVLSAECGAADLVLQPEDLYLGRSTGEALSLFGGQTADLQGEALVAIAACVVIMVALMLFTGKSKVGTAMRAVSEDKGAAQLMGINVNTTISITFAIGSASCRYRGRAAVLRVPDPDADHRLSCRASRHSPLPYSAASARFRARCIGGILLGIIEIFAKAYISTQLSDAIVFAVLIVVLLVKPDGLLGKHVSEKV